MDTRVPPPSETTVDARLAAIEDGLAAVDERLARLEATLRDAVAEVIGDELEGVGEGLRRSVSDLGRMMLRDLDRLTRILSEHRDDIVTRLDDLRGGPRAYAADLFDETAAIDVPAGGAALADAEAADAGAAAAAPAAASAAPSAAGEAGEPEHEPLGEEGRFRMPGRRRKRTPAPG